jgi:tetratricopeptide (TPR) repeat protein
MSSCLPLIFMALSSFLFLPRGGFQGSDSTSIADLLQADEVDKAEALLDAQPRSAEAISFHGEIAFRRGVFAQAEALYGEALRMDEKTARAHFGLGRLALSRLKAGEAVDQFKRAVALAPGVAIFHFYLGEAYSLQKNYSGQKGELEQYIKLIPPDPDRLTEAKAAVEIVKALGTKNIGVAVAPPNPNAVPFQKMLNLIFAEARVDGRGPYRFVVDTGATQVVLSEKLLAELHLQPIASTVMHGVGGAGKVESKLYKVSEFEIGDVKITNFPVGTFSDPLVTQLADGIIGTAALSDFVVGVNYPQSRLELSRKPPAAVGQTLDGRYFSNLILIPLELNGRFQGNFVVDTGAVTTVLSHSMAAKLGVTEETAGAKVDAGLVGVGGMQGSVLRVKDVTFRVGELIETFPQVVSIDLKQISKMIGTEVSGVIGYDFLADYNVILNYKTAEVRLVK